MNLSSRASNVCFCKFVRFPSQLSRSYRLSSPPPDVICNGCEKACFQDCHRCLDCYPQELHLCGSCCAKCHVHQQLHHIQIYREGMFRPLTSSKPVLAAPCCRCPRFYSSLAALASQGCCPLTPLISLPCPSDAGRPLSSLSKFVFLCSCGLYARHQTHISSTRRVVHLTPR